MPPLSEIPLEGRLTRPAKHGWTLDYSTPEGRRVHVRVFAFETGLINGVPYDSPSTLGREEVVECLMTGAEKIQKLVEAAEWEKPMQAVAAGTLTPGDVNRVAETVGFLNLPLEGTGEEESDAGGGDEPSDGSVQRIYEGLVTDAAQRVPTSDDGALGTKLPAIRRVLFLDVDGVLNTRPGSLDMDKILLVRELVDATGAAVVISSSWRNYPDQMLRLKRSLDSVGIEPIGRTPFLVDRKYGTENYVSVPRWQELQAWLLANPSVDQFVILDDDDDLQRLEKCFVQTKSFLGMGRPELVEAFHKFRDQAAKVGDVLPHSEDWLVAEMTGGHGV